MNATFYDLHGKLYTFLCSYLTKKSLLDFSQQLMFSNSLFKTVCIFASGIDFKSQYNVVSFTYIMILKTRVGFLKLLISIRKVTGQEQSLGENLLFRFHCLIMYRWNRKLVLFRIYNIIDLLVILPIAIRLITI